MVKWWTRIATWFLIAAATIPWIAASSAQTLRIGLAEDPDILDPTLARTYVGRIVFAALCDKLVDIGPELEIVPQLATAWQWTDGNKGLVVKLRPGVKFQDGEPLDAAAVKFNIERHLTMPGSNRKGEINAVSGVEIRLVLAVEHDLVERFAVDRQLERLAHPRILPQRRLRALAIGNVDGDPQIAEPVDCGELETRVLAHGFEIGCSNPDEVEPAGLQIGPAARCCPGSAGKRCVRA
jgi:hypothetical protein